MTKPSKFISAGGIEEVKRLIREKRSAEYISKKFGYSRQCNFYEAMRRKNGTTYAKLYKEIHGVSRYSVQKVNITAERIKDRLDKYFTLAQAGEEFNYHPTTLSRIFKAKYHITPQAYKRNKRNGIY